MDQAGRSLLTAIPQAAVDVVEEAFLPVVGKVVPGINKALVAPLKGGFLARTGQSVARTAAVGGAGEVAQQVGERYAAGLPTGDSNAAHEYAVAGAVGAALSGAFGTIGGFETHTSDGQPLAENKPADLLRLPAPADYVVTPSGAAVPKAQLQKVYTPGTHIDFSPAAITSDLVDIGAKDNKAATSLGYDFAEAVKRNDPEGLTLVARDAAATLGPQFGEHLQALANIFHANPDAASPAPDVVPPVEVLPAHLQPEAVRKSVLSVDDPSQPPVPTASIHVRQIANAVQRTFAVPVTDESIAKLAGVLNSKSALLSDPTAKLPDAHVSDIRRAIVNAGNVINNYTIYKAGLADRVASSARVEDVPQTAVAAQDAARNDLSNVHPDVADQLVSAHAAQNALVEQNRAARLDRTLTNAPPEITDLVGYHRDVLAQVVPKDPAKYGTNADLTPQEEAALTAASQQRVQQQNEAQAEAAAHAKYGAPMFQAGPAGAEAAPRVVPVAAPSGVINPPAVQGSTGGTVVTPAAPVERGQPAGAAPVQEHPIKQAEVIPLIADAVRQGKILPEDAPRLEIINQTNPPLALEELNKRISGKAKLEAVGEKISPRPKLTMQVIAERQAAEQKGKPASPSFTGEKTKFLEERAAEAAAQAPAPPAPEPTPAPVPKPKRTISAKTVAAAVAEPAPSYMEVAAAEKPALKPEPKKERARKAVAAGKAVSEKRAEQLRAVLTSGNAAGIKRRSEATAPIRADEAPAKKITGKVHKENVTRRGLLSGAAGALVTTAAHAANLGRTSVASNTAVQDALKTGSLQKVLEAIANTSTNPAHKELAHALALGGVGDARIKVATYPDPMTQAGSTLLNGDVTVNKWPGADDGYTEETILHEANHSWLTQRIGDIEDYTQEARDYTGVAGAHIDPFVDAFQNLYDHFAVTMMTKHGDKLGLDGPVWLSEAVFSPDEAFTRVLTDPDLIAFLKTIDENGDPYSAAADKPPSMWQRFWRLIADWLHIAKPETRSFYYTLNGAAKNIIKSGTLDTPTGEFLKKLPAFKVSEGMQRYFDRSDQHAELSEGEHAALGYSRARLLDGTYQTNPDGSVTTFKGAIDNPPGSKRFMYYPTFWDGKVLPRAEAMDRALASDVKFPTYDTLAKAEAAEARVHAVMENDAAVQARAIKEAAIIYSDVGKTHAMYVGRVATATDVKPGSKLPSAADNLNIAEQMEAAGVDKDKIRAATGFFKNTVDGKWRYELSDASAQLTDVGRAIQQTRPVRPGTIQFELQDIIKHPELFRVFPEMRNIPVFVTHNPGWDVSGAYTPDTDVIDINVPPPPGDGARWSAPPAVSLAHVLLHEAQHAVQSREGFSRGGNTNLREMLKSFDTPTRQRLGQEVLQAADKEAEYTKRAVQVMGSLTPADQGLWAANMPRRAPTGQTTTSTTQRIALVNVLRQKFKDAGSLDPIIDAAKLSGMATSGGTAMPSDAARNALMDRYADIRLKSTLVRVRSFSLVSATVQTSRVSDLMGVLDMPGSPQANPGRKVYTRLMGEIEAEATAARANLSVAERQRMGEYEGPAGSEIGAKGQETYSSGKAFLREAGAGPQARTDSGVEENVAKYPKDLQPTIRAVATSADQYGTNITSALSSTPYLTDQAVRAGVRAARTLERLKTDALRTVQQANQIVDNMQQVVSKVPERERRFGPGSVNALLQQARQNDEWPFNPGKWLRDQDGNPVDHGYDVSSATAKKFRAMSSAAQAAVEKVMRDQYDSHMMKQKEAGVNVRELYQQIIDIATARGDIAGAREAAADRDALLDKYHALLKTDISRPYSSMRGTGNFVAVGMSPTYQKAEAEARATGDARDWKHVNELRQDSAHYLVHYLDTQFAANKFNEDHLKTNPNYTYTDAFRSSDSEHVLFGGKEMYTAFNRLTQMVNESHFGEDTVANLRKAIADLQLHTLGQASSRNAERKFENVSRGPMDMVRSAANQIRADAHFVSTIRHSGDIAIAIRKMDKEAEDRTASKATRDRRIKLVRELKLRHKLDTQLPGSSPIVNAITGFTTYKVLLASPSYYIQQIMQNAVQGIPLLAGEYGGRAYNVAHWKRAWDIVAAAAQGRGVSGPLDLSKLDAKYQPLARFLEDNGILDVGLNVEVQKIKSDSPHPAAVFLRAITRPLTGITRRMEAVNRLTMAIMAFDAETDAAKTRPTQVLYDAGAYDAYVENMREAHPGTKPFTEVQFAAAYKAQQLITLAHYNYSDPAKSRLLRTPVGKVVGQFKTFAMGQAETYIRMLHNGFFDDAMSPEEKAVARRTLLFMTGHAAAVAGALGLPAAALLRAIAEGLMNMLMPDEDQPADLEQMFRNALGPDGQGVADALLYGLPTVAGLNLSGSMGQGNILSLAPYTPLPSDANTYADYLAALAGPAIGGVGMDMAKAVADARNGDYYKGLERLMPKGVTNLMRAARTGTQGITNTRGDVTLPASDIGPARTAATAVGLQTIQGTRQQQMLSRKIETDTRMDDRAGRLKKDYSAAFEKNDYAAMTRLRQEWAKLQDSRDRLGYARRPLKELTSAPLERRKRERLTRQGVRYEKPNLRQGTLLEQTYGLEEDAAQ